MTYFPGGVELNFYDTGFSRCYRLTRKVRNSAATGSICIAHNQGRFTIVLKLILFGNHLTIHYGPEVHYRVFKFHSSHRIEGGRVRTSRRSRISNEICWQKVLVFFLLIGLIACKCK